MYDLRVPLRELREEFARVYHGQRLWDNMPWDMVGDVAVSIEREYPGGDLASLLLLAYNERCPTLLAEALYPDLTTIFGVYPHAVKRTVWRPWRVVLAREDFYTFECRNRFGEEERDPFVWLPAYDNLLDEYSVVFTWDVIVSEDEVLTKNYQRLVVSPGAAAGGQTYLSGFDTLVGKFSFDFLAFWHFVHDHQEVLDNLERTTRQRIHT